MKPHDFKDNPNPESDITKQCVVCGVWCVDVFARVQ